MNEEYEKALNESFNASHNLPKNNYGRIPAVYSTAFGYGYTFGMQQAREEQKENEKITMDFQRVQIATAALQGLLASGIDCSNSITHIVNRAIAYANEMMDELKKNKDENNM